MGYRSDVGISVCMSELSLALSVTDDSLRREIEKLLREADLTRCGLHCMRLYVWNDIKWYREFEPMAWLEAFAQNSDFGRFVRLGEDAQDIDEHGNLEYGSVEDCFELSHTRALSYDS